MFLVQIFFSVFYLLLSFSALAEDFSNSATYLDQVISNATNEKLWTKRSWQKILFIPDKPLSFTSPSMVTEKDFFLSPNGRRHPDQEMIATLRSFFDPSFPIKVRHNMPTQCMYAARFSWLVDELKIDPSQVKFENCPELNSFVHAAEYTGVSLVFSNYFADNPGSLFGHTFLRLHRTTQLQTDSALLDDISNFAAAVPNTTSLLYPIKGLAGGYKGKFSLVPYYVKIQEYNNAQSRDLWEYELNLTQKEIRMLELELWEMGWTYIDYYYLDDNCSYVMLALLEAAKPELYLTDKLWIYAIPSDTVRVVNRTPGLVKKSQYRPSVLSRYISRLSLLDKNKKARLSSMLASNLNSAEDLGKIFKDCDAFCKTHIMDAAIDYIDFKEKLVGERDPVIYGDLRKNILTARSYENVKAESLEKLKPQSTSPARGHDSGLVTLSGGAYLDNGKSFATLRWRPALHDLEANDLGYSDGLGIGFMDTIIRTDINDKKVYLQNFHVLEITSLPPQVQDVNYFSWHFDSGYEKDFGFGEVHREGRGYLQFGMGTSYYALKNRLMTYALLHGDVGYAHHFDFHMGPTLTVGAMAHFSSQWKLIAKLEAARRFHFVDKNYLNSVKGSLTVATYFAQNWEGRLTFASNDHVPESSFGVQYYF